MFNDKKTINLYVSADSYNTSTPDIVLADVTIDSVKENIIIIKDSNGYTHILNINKFTAIVF